LIKFDPYRCVGCGGCVSVCSEKSLRLINGRITIDDSCNDCGICAKICPHGALYTLKRVPGKLDLIRHPKMEYDIIIVGAGPAGSTAAIFAAQMGASVLLLERRPIVGVPQVCAEGISYTGLTNVIPDVNDNWIATPIEGAVLVAPSGNRTVVNHPRAGFILERRVFDRDLFRMAGGKGADTFTSARVDNLIWRDEHIVGVEYRIGNRSLEARSKIIIAADGLESSIANKLFDDCRLSASDIHVAAQVVMAGIDVEKGFPEFHVGRQIAPGGYGWVFPKGDGWGNVGLGINPSLIESTGITAWDFLQSFIERRFGSSGKVIEVASGNVPTANRLKRIAYRNVLFIGDAGRLTDPISGGGLANALLSGKLAGELAAKSLESRTPEMLESNLSAFSRIWDRVMGRQMAFYYKAKGIFARLSDDDLEEICLFIENRFEDKAHESIDIPGTIRAIIHQKKLFWGLLKAVVSRKK